MPLESLAAVAGLDLRAVGPDNLDRVARQAMARLDLTSLAAYTALLTQDPSERSWLLGQAVVQETWYFREPEAFTLLEAVAGELVHERARDAARPLRLLSAPCATDCNTS